MRKYGTDQFTVKIIESQVDEAKLDEREIYWIAKLNPQYNLTKGGGGGDVSSSPNWISAMEKSHRNRKPESYATYGMLGKKFPEEGKKKISKANSHPVVCEGKEFSSIKAAEEYYRSLGTPKSVRKRIDSAKHPDWYRLKEKRSHPRSLTNII